MKQFTSNGTTLLAIEVDDYYNYKISGNNWLCFSSPNSWSEWTAIEKLPEGKWEILFCTNSYTEEDCREVVERIDVQIYDQWCTYFIADGSLVWHPNGMTAFQSLMESIACPIINKYGEQPKFSALDFISPGIDTAELIEQWESEQDKIKTYLILEILKP